MRAKKYLVNLSHNGIISSKDPFKEKKMKITRLLFALCFIGGFAFGEPLRLEYKARSGMLSLGNTSIFIDSDNKNYNIQMDRNLSWPGVVKDLSSTAVSGTIKGSSLSPKDYHQTRTGRELTRATNIRWENGVPNVSMSPEIQTNEKTYLDIATAKNSIDPLSSIFYVMMQMDKTGSCSGSFISFDGFSSINTRLIPLGEKFVDTQAFSGSAMGCRLEMRGISGLVMGGKRAKETTAMDMWLGKTQDNTYIPVLIQSEEGVRSVALRLIDFSQ